MSWLSALRMTTRMQLGELPGRLPREPLRGPEPPIASYLYNPTVIDPQGLGPSGGPPLPDGAVPVPCGG